MWYANGKPRVWAKEKGKETEDYHENNCLSAWNKG